METSLDVQLFWFSFWAYLIGWLSFTVWLAARKKVWTTIGSICFAAGFVPQTIAFFLRWNYTGHFPMSNMYEYMAVMSWMAVVSFAFLTWRYRNWVISALISPVVIMLMVAASLLPKDPSQQLMPALRSSWLMIHVSLASIGAGAFAVAAAVSFVYLLAVRSEEEAKKTFRPAMRIPFIVLIVIPVILAIFGNVSHVLAKQSTMQCFGAPMSGGNILLLLGIYFVVAGVIWTRMFRKTSDVETRYWAAIGFSGLFLGALGAGILLSGGKISLTENSPLRIFEFFGLTLVLGTVGTFALHTVLGFGAIPGKLHLDGKLLDEVNYRAVALGYPLYTLGALFAGAIWAESAWGSFWSWDPKEVGALIIWLFYSAFLHARYQRGWSGPRTAVLSLIGFAMMMLSLFGNFFFGGLHAYA
jgi:ABC-type transport system involved in cytochrome c biogenesis permease subunit